MVDILEGTQIGVDGVRYPIDELPTNPASDYYKTSVFVVGEVADGEVPVYDSDLGHYVSSPGGGDTPANAVLTTGNQSVGGVKTFTSDPVIPDEVYDATNWNGVLEPPTKNAVRDKIEDLLDGVTFTGDVVVPDEAYDATAWNANLEIPTKNAVRDRIEALLDGDTFTGPLIVPDEAYDEAGWNADLSVPTKNSVRDLFEGMSELFADDTLELQIDPDGRVTILATIARTVDVQGVGITAAAAYALANPIIARKTGDQDLTTTSAVDITDMACAGLLASSRYQVEGLIHYDGPTGASNLVPSFTVPSGATGHQHIIGPSSAESGIAPAASVPFRQRTWAQAEEFGGVGAGVNATTWLRGLLITAGSSGTLQLQGRQSAGPDATPITILTGSYMIARYLGAA